MDETLDHDTYHYNAPTPILYIQQADLKRAEDSSPPLYHKLFLNELKSMKHRKANANYMVGFRNWLAVMLNIRCT